MTVNTGHGLYITPGARVLVRTEGEPWPGYVTGDNGLGDLWVHDPAGRSRQVRWTQVSAAPNPPTPRPGWSPIDPARPGRGQPHNRRRQTMTQPTEPDKTASDYEKQTEPVEEETTGE